MATALHTHAQLCNHILYGMWWNVPELLVLFPAVQFQMPFTNGKDSDSYSRNRDEYNIISLIFRLYFSKHYLIINTNKWENNSIVE